MTRETFPRPTLTARTSEVYDPWSGEPTGETERLHELAYLDDRYELGTSFAYASTVTRDVTLAVDAGREVFPCGWIVEDYYPEGETFTRPCGAPVSADPVRGGFVGIGCGHSHDPSLEYYADDELEHALASGAVLPANAARMNGTLVS